MTRIPTLKRFAIGMTLGAMMLLAVPVAAKELSLLNVSYDPTREFYEDYNKLFAAHWKSKTGDIVKINQSHGGSGKQARSILEGLEADVATLALSNDIDQLAIKGKLIDPAWQKRLPNNSSPYTSTIVFLVRKGNPQGIKDWNDLAKKGITVVAPNPKTGGGARWVYLAGWGYGVKTLGSDDAAKELIRAIYANAGVLDSGARGSTVTFAEREQGDALITWENEAHLIQKEFGSGKFEIIYPSISILAEPSVAVVDVFAKKHGNTEVAEAYLQFLYTKEAQELQAAHYYRPSDKAILAKHAHKFPAIQLFTIDELFGGWEKAQARHFADGGIFDQIYGIKK